MPDKSDDAEESSPVRPDDATKIIRAKAERLDVRKTTDPAKIDEAPPEIEVVALRKRVQQQRTALLTTGALLIVLLIVLFVVIATPTGRSEGSGSTSTATTTTATTTTTTSSSTPRAEPTTTTTTTESVTTPPSSTPVASGESPAPRTVAAPPVHLNGQDYIRSGNTYDLDRANEFGGDGDIVHDGQAISGNEGAQLALGKAGSDEYARCDPTLLKNSWRSHIPFSEVPVGSVLCVWTNEGRVSYLEITGAPNSNGGDYLYFRWTTWQK